MPTLPPRVVAVRLPTSWRIVPSLLARDYVLEQKAVIEISTDSGTFNDTTAISTDLSLRQTANGGAAGLVRAVLLSTAGAGPAAIPGLSLPLTFAVPVRVAGVLGTPSVRPTPTGDPCRSPAEVSLGPIRDLLLQLPDSVTIGSTWTDSGSYRTCRDGVLLTFTTDRTFRVHSFVESGDDGSLSVERTTRTMLRGSAVRGDDTTSVSGSGTGQMTLMIDVRTGAILSGDGSGTLDLTVRGRTRFEHARQVLQSRITRRTP